MLYIQPPGRLKSDKRGLKGLTLISSAFTLASETFKEDV